MLLLKTHEIAKIMVNIKEQTTTNSPDILFWSSKIFLLGIPTICWPKYQKCNLKCSHHLYRGAMKFSMYMSACVYRSDFMCNIYSIYTYRLCIDGAVVTLCLCMLLDDCSVMSNWISAGAIMLCVHTSYLWIVHMYGLYVFRYTMSISLRL